MPYSRTLAILCSLEIDFDRKKRKEVDDEEGGGDEEEGRGGGGEEEDEGIFLHSWVVGTGLVYI